MQSARDARQGRPRKRARRHADDQRERRRLSRSFAALAQPVDIASLAVFRVLLGSLMAVAVLRFMAAGWVSELYIEPRFYFAFEGLEWVRPWPGVGMHVHFLVLLALALCVALGLWYRVSAALLCVGFTYVELLDKTNYLNH